MKLITYIFLSVASSMLISFKAPAQDTLRLELQEVIDIVQIYSWGAVEAKSLFRASYYERKYFGASLMPGLRANLLPFTFDRTMTKRYDSETNRDVYRPQQTLSSYFNLAVQHTIPLTGSMFYFDTDLGLLKNFQEDGVTTDYSTTPFRVGFKQPILAYNELKWQKRIVPLQYELAKRKLILERVTLNLKVVELFFDLALAYARSKMQLENIQSSTKLFELGKKRFEIGAIERKDLLNLELSTYTASNEYAAAQVFYRKTLYQLYSVLNKDLGMKVIPILPEIHNNLSIDIENALLNAEEAHPDFVDFKTKLLEAEREIDKFTKQNRYDISLDASYGFNQRANTLSGLYQDFLDQQRVGVTISVPIFDWNARHYMGKAVEAKRKGAESKIAQNQAAFKIGVQAAVADFNQQAAIMYSQKKAMEIALELYGTTSRRLQVGGSSVNELAQAWLFYQGAHDGYLTSIRNYWVYYYKVQQLTLFD